MEFPKMTAVCVCGGCGRTIEKDYVFCPWCGRSRVTNEDCEEAVESAFERIEEQQYEKYFSRLEKMEEKLNVLERDLGVLALSSEMHK